MVKRLLFISVACVGLFGLALVVAAQGPGMRGGFGRGGPGEGGRGSVACAPSCPQYQFTFTRTSVEPVLLPAGPSEVTHNSTGTIAGDQYGSTYRDETLPGWGSQSKPQEFIYVRDLDPGVMMSYIVNVTKGTYEQFPINLRTPPAGENGKPNWQGGARPPGKGPGGSGTGPTITKLTNYVLDSTYTCPEGVQTTFSRGADFTSNRIFCSTLNLVLEEDHSDPRFGSSTYKLSNYTGLSVFPFTPKGTLAEHPRFGHGGGPGGAGHSGGPPPPLG